MASAPHGAPLGSDEATSTREQLGWKYGEFEIPDSVYDVFKAHAAEGAKKQEAAELEKKEAAKQLDSSPRTSLLPARDVYSPSQRNSVGGDTELRLEARLHVAEHLLALTNHLRTVAPQKRLAPGQHAV